jgi:3-dehydrotetronate 4-kinase
VGSLVLGCIADDFTGATDLANNLVRAGMRVVLTVGVPGENQAVDGDAVVVALKSRTVAAALAVEESLRACRWLRRQGASQIYFKICSTFDSTAAGNIGPVIEALMEELHCGFSVATPAFPENGRTVVHGHLFLGDTLLSDSGMRHHPLTPMTDANLVRVLSRQTDGTVGLVPYATVEQGPIAIRAAMTELKEQGRRYAIVDAVSDAHLAAIGEAAEHHALITGGSGVAVGLPDNFRRSGLLPERNATALPTLSGHAAVIAGSCSRATLAQVGMAREVVPVLQLDPIAQPDTARMVAKAREWVADKLGTTPIVIAASAPPDKVTALQQTLGRDAAGALIEQTLALIAEDLVARGVRRLIVAGGETAGAVVSRLGVRRLRIGGEIDPGVPWTYAEGGVTPLLLALKSGNFGARDFFIKAFEALP